MSEPRKDPRKALGSMGELLAAQHLSAAGMMIAESNWRSRSGEIDLIADDRGTLVFIEVRTRRDTGTYGTPAESVDARKIKQVRETAAYYLQKSRAFDRRIRFDVVTVLLSKEGALREVRHIPNAF